MDEKGIAIDECDKCYTGLFFFTQKVGLIDGGFLELLLFFSLGRNTKWNIARTIEAEQSERALLVEGFLVLQTSQVGTFDF
jgi:hypothetical protein